jgi:hypothetical protein
MITIISIKWMLTAHCRGQQILHLEFFLNEFE